MSAERDQPAMADFGSRLRSWRQRNRVTQRQLAADLGYNVTYIVKIEAGDRPPTRQFLARLTQVAGEPAEVLLQAPAHDVGRPPLPAAPDDLIGRQADLERLVDVLAGPARCVTLVGPPGIGKTRLAMAAAATLDAVFQSGSWWVPLVDVARSEEVGHRVSEAMGVRQHNAGDPIDAVVERLGSQEALLVLDNFEHVIEARTVVSRLVAGAPGLTVLVTSREALRLVSEHVLAVPRLAYPDSGTTSLEEIRAHPAVELFLARASMARPDFTLSAINRDSVVDTCARLEGLPLAIVLAAGRVTTEDAAGVAARLAVKPDLDSEGPADLPAHHRTLAVAIESSWRLLGRHEQRFLASLAVFAGGFTAEGARAVGTKGDVGQPKPTADEALAALVRKSLLEARPDAAGGPRFEMLEAIRTFALERLEQSGGAEEARRRHAAYHVTLAEECGPGLTGHRQAECLEVLSAELANLRVAFRWTAEHDPEGAIRLAASLWRFFLIADLPTGGRWLEEALALAPEPTPARATAMAAAGALSWITGQPQRSQQYLADAAVLASQLGRTDIVALATVNQGALAEQQDRLDDAERSFVDALRLYESIGDRRGRGVALIGRGMVDRRRGDVAAACPMWIEAAAHLRAVGDRFNETIALGNLAWAAESEGQFDEAEAFLDQCRRTQIALGDARGLACTTSALGRLAYKQDRFDDARGHQLAALVSFQRLGDVPWSASALLAVAAIESASSRHDVALRLLGAAESLWERMGTSDPRDEEAVLRDVIVARAEGALAAGTRARARGTGRAMTLDEAVDLATGAIGGGAPPEHRHR